MTLTDSNVRLYGTSIQRRRQATGMTIYLGTMAVIGVVLSLIAWLRFDALTAPMAAGFGLGVFYTLAGIWQVRRRYRYLNILDLRGVGRDIVATVWAWTVRDMALLFFVVALAFFILGRIARG
jgi:hypothetical protein